METKPIDARTTKAVFFDRGNVLYDCRRGPSQSEKNRDAAGIVAEILRAKAATVSADDVLAGFIQPWKDSFSERDKRGHEIPVDAFLSDYLGFAGIQCDQKEIDEIVDAMSIAFLKWHELDLSIIPLIEKLRTDGKKTGIVSNAVLPDRVFLAQLKKDNLDELFDVCVFSCGAGMRKPNRKILELACRKAEVAPKESILVGDKIEKDVLCAKNAGAKSIWFNESGRVNESDIEPDYEVCGFEEIRIRLVV